MTDTFSYIRRGRPLAFLTCWLLASPVVAQALPDAGVDTTFVKPEYIQSCVELTSCIAANSEQGVDHLKGSLKPEYGLIPGCFSECNLQPEGVRVQA